MHQYKLVNNQREKQSMTITHTLDPWQFAQDAELALYRGL